jgi:hypothetical protein
MKRQALLMVVVLGVLLAVGAYNKGVAVTRPDDAEEKEYAKIELKGRLQGKESGRPGPLPSGPYLQIGDNQYHLKFETCCQKQYAGDGWKKLEDKRVIATGRLRITKEGPEVEVESIRVLDE